MREITGVIIHCSDTPNGRRNTVQDIDQWHRARGFSRRDVFRRMFNPLLQSIGYHYVIYDDGSVHTGRCEEEIGAHCEGANSNSLGVCLLGTDKFSPAQWDALKLMLTGIEDRWRGASVSGHRNWPSAIRQGKTCPNFDVTAYVTNGFVPDPQHILD